MLSVVHMSSRSKKERNIPGKQQPEWIVPPGQCPAGASVTVRVTIDSSHKPGSLCINEHYMYQHSYRRTILPTDKIHCKFDSGSTCSGRVVSRNTCCTCTLREPTTSNSRHKWHPSILTVKFQTTIQISTFTCNSRITRHGMVYIIHVYVYCIVL